MKAVIINGESVVGYHEEPNLEYFESLGTTYDLLETLPDIIVNAPPKGYRVIRKGPGNYLLESLPYVSDERIVQLEDESAMLALELVDSQIRLDDTERRLEQSETEQAALLLELVDKGVL